MYFTINDMGPKLVFPLFRLDQIWNEEEIDRCCRMLCFAPLHHNLHAQFCGRYAKAVCVCMLFGGEGVHSRISLWSVSLADVM